MLTALPYQKIWDKELIDSNTEVIVKKLLSTKDLNNNISGVEAKTDATTVITDTKSNTSTLMLIVENVSQNL